MKYNITIRGPVPPDLGHKVASAHAAALKDAKQKPTRAGGGPVGEGAPDDRWLNGEVQR